ncbi:MAG: hypothetical protein JXB46_06125, partial [Candidatus Eisenbacteria bacterium]|nr:hypothetical protein [Candidatus Eisenbacteria bacterium]
RETIEALAALPRASEHARRLEFLDEASAALSRAEDMRSGAQYEDARELVDRLSLEERRFEVRGDGSVVAVKPAGDSYTGVAREAVEWLLQRELASSGSAFPNSHLKTDDERAWARYMILARRVAEAEGADFAQLLSSDREVELHLPEPTHCFPD